MKNFKAVITTNKDAQVGQHQQKVVVNLPFSLEIEIDKNDQISNIYPRTFKGVDLFSKYHGRPSLLAVAELAKEMSNLNTEEVDG